jgi:hypothetical protein
MAWGICPHPAPGHSRQNLLNAITMTQRNHLYRFLMLLSLFLLVVFQAYWLRKVYQEQKELLNKEIDNIFVQGVRDMQDSIFRAGMLYIGKRDSTDGRQKTIIVIAWQTAERQRPPISNPGLPSINVSSFVSTAAAGTMSGRSRTFRSRRPASRRAGYSAENVFS